MLVIVVIGYFWNVIIILNKCGIKFGFFFKYLLMEVVDLLDLVELFKYNLIL